MTSAFGVTGYRTIGISSRYFARSIAILSVFPATSVASALSCTQAHCSRKFTNSSRYGFNPALAQASLTTSSYSLGEQPANTILFKPSSTIPPSIADIASFIVFVSLFTSSTPFTPFTRSATAGISTVCPTSPSQSQIITPIFGGASPTSMYFLSSCPGIGSVRCERTAAFNAAPLASPTLSRTFIGAVAVPQAKIPGTVVSIGLVIPVSI